MMILVHKTGSSVINVPPEMGEPRADQLCGTVGEQLVELCGRVCYDSLGTGRSSVEYHKHIIEVGHLSVLEHVNFCVHWPIDYLEALVNKIGCYWDSGILCLNLRTAYEWPDECEWSKYIKSCAKIVAPAYFSDADDENNNGLVAPSSLRDEEHIWYSFYMVGSRGFSHEQVRHGDRTAISQRSTRYCDEAYARFVNHPLLNEYLIEEDDEEFELLLRKVNITREIYMAVFTKLESWLVRKGIAKSVAIKQARGAARLFLPNALETAMIFSASLSQWKRMIAQRVSIHADREINDIYLHGVCKILCK